MSRDCSPQVQALSPDSHPWVTQWAYGCTHVEYSLILEGQTEERFEQIFTMSLKPLGQGTRG